MGGPGRCLVPHASQKPAVFYKGLVLVVIGIILECVLFMLKFEPEEEQLSWLYSIRRNREPLKCIWVSKAGCTEAENLSSEKGSFGSTYFSDRSCTFVAAL